jgi:hypothetical protein
VSALEGKEVKFTDTNFTGLQRLCEEFSFSEFAAKLSKFRRSMGFQETEDADARERIAALEERVNQHDCAIAVLQDKFTQLSTDFVFLAGEVSALRFAAAPSVPTPTPQPTQPSPPPSSPRFRKSVPPSLPKLAVPSGPSVESRIISGFPEIFAEFRGKRFSLLWRGGRDGFKAQEFHRRCFGCFNSKVATTFILL